MDINQALGKAISEHRKRARITQAQLPYDQGSLSKIENGKQGLSMEKLLEVAQAIGSTPSAIWATAEDLMAIKSKPDRLAFFEALTSFVEATIDQAPKVIPQLQNMLSLLALHGNPQEKKFVQRLSALVEKQSLSAATRRKSKRG